MLRFPNCKINIGLYILNRRPDGFHSIQSIFYPLHFLSDALEIVESQDDSDHFFVSGIPINEPIGENICYKAVKLLRKKYQFPSINLYLKKMVPMGAGLGGGSADATCTLMMLNELFDLNISHHQMIQYASELGSDCAFFVNSTPQLGEGRGELLSQVDVSLTGKYLLIIKPDIHVSTAVAFQKVNPNNTRLPLINLLKNDIHLWKDLIFNDFESSVFESYPQIASIKKMLYEMGATYAQMSGSGAACYGIFNEKPKMDELPNGWISFGGVL